MPDFHSRFFRRSFRRLARRWTINILIMLVGALLGAICILRGEYYLKQIGKIQRQPVKKFEAICDEPGSEKSPRETAQVYIVENEVAAVIQIPSRCKGKIWITL